MTDILSARRHTPRQIALGLFVVWQLVFLVSANVLAFFPHGTTAEGELSDSRNGEGSEKYSGLIQDIIDTAGQATDRYGFLTGQVQAWWLFAPDFPKQATFPEVELTWASLSAEDGKRSGLASESSTPGTVVLRSSLEPENPCHYFKAPGSGDRLFHYEGRLGLVMLYWDPALVSRFPTEWRDAVANRVRRQWRSIRAYLRWRILQFHEQHPDLPLPAQAVLRIRIFRSPAPGQYPARWEGPFDLPLARWRLDREPDPGALPVEVFDPIANRFVPLEKDT